MTRLRTPTVLQMEAAECGAAALGIILGYHGRHVSLEALRAACGVSRDGSKAGNIARAARGYGLVASGKRYDISELRAATLPAIVFWNFNHFVVVEGFGPGVVYLNDPAIGPCKVSDEEFGKAYTGVALVFERGPDFRPGGERRSLRRALAARLQGSRGGFAFVLLATLGLVLPGIVLPVFTQVFVDRVLIEGMDDWLGPLLLGMSLTLAVRTGLTALQRTQLLRLEMRLAMTASATFLWHVLRLPVSFFSQRYAGDIGQRVSANDRIAKLLAGDLASNAANALSLVFFAAIMLQYDVTLTLVGIAMAALNLVTLRALARRRRDGNRRLLQDRGRWIAVTIGGIETIETIKANGAEHDFFARWAGHLAKVNNAQVALELQSRLLAVLPTVLNALVSVAILALGGARVIGGELSVGMLVAFQSLMASFLQPITNLMGLAGTLQEAEGDLARLDDVLNHPVDAASRTRPAPAIASTDGARSPLAPPSPSAPRDGSGETNGLASGASIDTPVASRESKAGSLSLRDVSFGYSRLEPPLIEHFDLEIGPGRRVALVGGSGSGKSTIARLVLGVHQPWSGQVLVDGVPRETLPPERLHATLGGVDQDIVLFEGTVRENLTLWDATLPQQDLIEAARDACIHDVIAARPGGYEAEVGESGANWSGGQRQRLEIARALATRPRVLVLDEATAALDALTEAEIDANLRRRGCACLIVAHRLSTLRDCDEIIVLDGGKVSERGTHDELVRRDGAYRSLIEAAR